MAVKTNEGSVFGTLPIGWEVRSLSELSTKIGSGATPRGGKSAYLKERVSHALIRSQHVFDRSFDSSGLAYISTDQSRDLRGAEVQSGDVLLNITGDGVTFARSCIVPDEILPACVNQHVSVIRTDRTICDPGYLLSFLTHPLTKVYMGSFSTGGSRRALTKGHIESFRIPLPPLQIQSRIASILSTYDDLIENCQRRIRILEAMARSLYREWFVQFRFPGHENHPRVDSSLGEIPEGWEVRRLDAVCRSVQDGDWIETKDQGGDAYRLAQISNIGVGEFIETDNYRFITQETFDRLRCTEVIPGEILVARMPTPIGRAWLATVLPWRMITAVDVAIIRTRPEVLNPMFLARAWNEPVNLNRIAAQASGTTRLRITRRELASMEFVVPPIDIQERFSEILVSQGQLMESLRLKIQNLRQTRDLLLPRLLSGQVDLNVA